MGGGALRSRAVQRVCGFVADRPRDPEGAGGADPGELQPEDRSGDRCAHRSGQSVMIVGDIVAVSDGFSLITLAPRSFFLAIVGFTVWYVLIIGNYQKTTKILD